jgi:hypothetical protein
VSAAGFYTAVPGDVCDRGPVVITYEGAQRMQQTIARMLALGPWADFVCEAESHPRFVTEQQARDLHVCPICEGPMRRAAVKP